VTGRPVVQVYPGLDALVGAAAEAIAGAAREAVTARGRFTIALAGGGTPRPVYALLADAYRDSVEWPRVEAFFGDERCVPPDHAESNFRMADDALLSRVPVGRVHRMQGELPPPEAAERYDAGLRGAVGLEPDGATFDLVILGVGADGHTASLFPGSDALAERTRWAVAVQAPDGAPVRDRVTLTLPAIDRARRTMVLCAGDAKRHVVDALVAGAADGGERYPAIRAGALHGVRWMVDRAAGGRDRAP
jgi:6-phosphogluconolactonase